jgi:methionine-rich copper-binding protein CopC
MSQREVAIVGKNNTRAQVTGQEELLVKVNTIGPVDLSPATLTALENVTVQNPAGAAAVNIQDGGNIITVDSNAIERTPTILRTSSNSSVAAGAYSVSFASVGTVDATVGGVTLKVGETINFDAGGIDNTLASISYDSSASGAELLIITLT